MTPLPDATPRAGGCWSLTADGLSFRDLNGNGELDPYEDPRRPIEERVDDLLARMTLEEKAAQLFHQGLIVPDDGSLGDGPDPLTGVSARGLVADSGLTHFNIYWGPGPRGWPSGTTGCRRPWRRHGSASRSPSPPTRGTASGRTLRRAWPARASRVARPVGLAATRDEGLVREFADIARREYLAVGIRLALHPTADLATEPRWCRAAGTFGEDAEVAAGMVAPTSGACRARRSARRASRA